MVMAGTAGTFIAKAVAAHGAPSKASNPDPQNPTETASNNYPVSDVRRYGLVANNSRAATNNSRALRALVSPTGGFTGNICFPNTSGADIYYFDDIIPFHDNIHIDLHGSTLEFEKTAAAADANSGFIFAVRDFSIANGSIVVKYAIGAAASSAGSAVHIGSRGADSTNFSPTYDSMLKVPMGNITIRNLRIKSNVFSGNAIEMTGGLAGIIIENVWIDGQSSLSGGIYYEFGWATSGTTKLRETSHAHNMRFSNINITNLQTRAGAAVTLAGAYNCVVDGLYVNGAAAAFNGTSGESLFYRPWGGVDEVGAKRTIALRNIVAQGITGTALTLGGAQRAAQGYLASGNLPVTAQTDLGDYLLDGFALEGSARGWGIYSSAGKADIRNGRISGFQRGIVQGDDCTRMLINAVDVIDCAQSGMQLDIGGASWSPPRQKMGEIRNCLIAGNSKEGAGRYAAIQLDNCAGFLIENNRIGYERSHDGVVETTQGNAIQLGAHCANVICRKNYIAGVHDGSFGYYNVSDTDARGNTIQNPGGIATTHGSWDGITVRRRVVRFADSITVDATGSEQFDITATSNADFVINAPTNPVSGKTITITIRNASGGTLGKALWSPIFRMSGWANPANGHNRSIIFCFDDVHWFEIVRSGADVPN
jgi:hypothetical protein